MLSARPMEPVASFALGKGGSDSSSADPSPSQSTDRLHILTHSGRTLRTSAGVLPSPHLLSPEPSPPLSSSEDDVEPTGTASVNSQPTATLKPRSSTMSHSSEPDSSTLVRPLPCFLTLYALTHAFLFLFRIPTNHD
jgi:hypothetical protein